MTEADELWLNRQRRLRSAVEWEQCEYLTPLIRTLDDHRATDRKLLLLTTASVRELQGTARINEQMWVIESLERIANDTTMSAEWTQVALALREIRLACTEVMRGMYWQASIDYPEEPETRISLNTWGTVEAVWVALGRRARSAAGLSDERPEDEHCRAGELLLCTLLRDIFGNPFRPVAFSADWRTSNAVAIARVMYESRDFGAMPILADALQDAGCDNEDILTHCRDTALTHVRGCWVVDAVLGKE